MTDGSEAINMWTKIQFLEQELKRTEARVKQLEHAIREAIDVEFWDTYSVRSTILTEALKKTGVNNG